MSSRVVPQNADLDRESKKRELDLKEREVAAREREVAAKEKELTVSFWRNPVMIGLFAASLGLMGNAYIAQVNNLNTQSVERLHAQSTLVLEAIKTNGNTDAACRNLVFFVNLGLLDDPRATIHAVERMREKLLPCRLPVILCPINSNHSS
jgi:hypothetical protein